MKKLSGTLAFRALAASVAEWLFAIMPLVVVAIVMAQLGRFDRLLEAREWAFGSAILSSQALMRFAGGVVRAGKTSVERILLVVALLLVGIVGPSNVVLVLVLTCELRDQHVPSGLSIAQLLLFCAASVTFIVFAAVGNVWTSAASVPEASDGDEAASDLVS